VTRLGIEPRAFSVPMLLTPHQECPRASISTREEEVDCIGDALPLRHPILLTKKSLF
jgi:hypothetical protein